MDIWTVLIVLEDNQKEGLENWMRYKLDMIVRYRDNKDQDMELYKFLYSDFFSSAQPQAIENNQIRYTVLTIYNPDRQKMTQKKLFTLSMYSCTENWPSSPFSKLSFSEVQNRVLVSFLVWAEAVLSRPSVCSALMKCHRSYIILNITEWFSFSEMCTLQKPDITNNPIEFLC